MENEENYICHLCGTVIEPCEGVFIENNDKCHCEACHPLLFTDEAWTALYNEWSVGEEGEDLSSDSYYWTTVPD